jgi:N-acetyltransferase
MNFSFSDNIVLENERALMRPLRADDLPNLVTCMPADASVVRYSTYYVHTQEHLQNFLSESLADRERQFRYPFIIFDKEKKAYAGSTSYAAISNRDARLEIGWTWINKPFQQTGLNRNCKFLLLQYAFDVLGAERVELKTDERNLQSRHAMEKMGAKYEGSLRSHTVMNDGFRRNTFYYSILKAEWEELKPVFLNRK